MAVNVPALIPLTGSRDAAQAVIDAILDLKQNEARKTAALKTMHAEQIAAARRQAAAELAAQKTVHAEETAALIAKAAAEIEALQRQLNIARQAAATLPNLQQRLNSCAYASALLAAAVKPPV